MWSLKSLKWGQRGKKGELLAENRINLKIFVAINPVVKNEIGRNLSIFCSINFKSVVSPIWEASQGDLDERKAQKYSSKLMCVPPKGGVGVNLYTLTSPTPKPTAGGPKKCWPWWFANLLFGLSCCKQTPSIAILWWSTNEQTPGSPMVTAERKT